MSYRTITLSILLASTPASATETEVLTVILERGEVHDGTGAPPRVADVGILSGRIVAIGDLEGRRAGERIDVSGLSVVPGFIDIHSHAEDGVFRHPLAENYIRQGVTTAVGGPDGGSPYPIAEYLARLDAAPAAINFAVMVGHGTVREAVLGNEDRAPTEAELIRMKDMVAQAMREGAFGLSSGLIYLPGAFATTEEVIELAKVAAYFDGIYISHMRQEGLQLLDSVRETIRIGEAGGLPAQITHHKVVGAPMWGKSVESLALVDEARARGVDITIDQYPYTASSTSLSILFPAWALEGTEAESLARLRDPGERPRIHAAIVKNLKEDRGGGNAKNVVVARCSWDPSLDGKSLADILKERGRPVTLEEAADLAIELQEKGGFSGIFHAIAEEDVQRILKHPQTMVASDGGIAAPGEGVPHPRNYGTFARVIGHYSRDRELMTFEEAIRKMSSFPARRLGLTDRGVLREGAHADVVVLDRDRVSDRAVFGDPHQYATGARHVFVNGVAVLRDEKMTGVRPGRALRHR